MEEYIIFYADKNPDTIEYDNDERFLFTNETEAIKQANKWHKEEKGKYACNQYVVYLFVDKKKVKKVYETV